MDNRRELPPQSTGNTGERLKVTSGQIVVIDQFMLANQQLTLVGGTSRVADYGGVTLNVSPGDYGIFREPRAQVMLVHPREARPFFAEDSAESMGEGGDLDVRDLLNRKDEFPQEGAVSVDTRAVLFIDASALADGELRKKYRRLWLEGKHKEARDFARERGAAVRYGFGRDSDKIAVRRPGNDLLLLHLQ